MENSSDAYRAMADSFREWLDDNSDLVYRAIETAVEEYIRNYGLPKIYLKEEDFDVP